MAEEERFGRIKHQAGFPKAIKLFRCSNIQIDELDISQLIQIHHQIY